MNQVPDPNDPLRITDKERLFALLAQHRKGQSRMIDAEALKAALKRRVRGQDHIIDHLAGYLRQQWAKEQRSTPIASLLFVGPPASGKTELCKALAESLFGNEKNVLRFDCGDFSGAEGKTRLIGTPTGYEGAAQGGQLTRPMLENPKRLILFDEVEKAYSGLFDLFLSLMGEGRLAEASSNRVADFTQAMVVLTSNEQHEAVSKLAEQIDDRQELSKAVRAALRESRKFRPELLSRFDQVYVFRPLTEEGNAEVVAIKIASSAAQYGVEVEFVDPLVVWELLKRSQEAEDTRAIIRIVDEMLSELWMQAREAGMRRVRVVLDSGGEPRCEESPLA